MPSQLVAVSPSTRWAAIYDSDKDQIVTLDLQNGADEVARIDAHRGGETPLLVFVPGSDLLLYASRAGVEVYKPESGERVRSIPIAGVATNLAVSPDGALIAAISPDGVVRIARLADGRELSAAFGDPGWALYTPDGYFEASRDGGRLLGIRANDRGYRVDQLALKYNRPDKIIDALGIGDPAASSLFRKRWEQKIAKLGLRADDIDGALADAPVVQITASEVTGAQATLHLALSSTSRDIASYSIYVGGVPVVTKTGPFAAGAPLRVDETVDLAKGNNIVEVSAVNAAGVESLRATREFGYAAPATTQQRTTLYFLGIGVSKYADSRIALEYAAKDPSDLGATFELLRSPTFDVKTKLLTDAAATADGVRNAASFFADATIDDTIVVFIAGHGGHGRDGNFYYVAEDTKIEQLLTTAVPFDAIEDLLTHGKARRRLLLLDTCESGARDDLGAAADRLPPKARSRAIRGLVLDAQGGGGGGSASADVRALLQQRTRYSLADLGRRSGAVVLSSARGDEASYELEDLKNGVFSAALIESLSVVRAFDAGDAPLSMEELRRQTLRFVVDKTGGQQHPTIDRDNPLADVGFPLRRHDPPPGLKQ
jgi:hypothetical protein